MVLNLFIEDEPPSDNFDEDEDAPVDPKVEAATYLQSIIDGSANLADPGVPAELGKIHAAYKDDADMLALFKSSVKAYSTYAVAKARTALAKHGHELQ